MYCIWLRIMQQMINIAVTSPMLSGTVILIYLCLYILTYFMCTKKNYNPDRSCLHSYSYSPLKTSHSVHSRDRFGYLLLSYNIADIKISTWSVVAPFHDIRRFVCRDAKYVRWQIIFILKDVHIQPWTWVYVIYIRRFPYIFRPLNECN